jgi:hypothetical protein
MEALIHIHLKPFLKQPTLMKAKRAFVAFHEKGLPIPGEIADFITREFRKEIISHPDNSVVENSEIDRTVLVELMIRIAKSRESESIDSICQIVAEESGIQGNETHTAGELLRKSMEEFRGRSKVRKKQ